MIRLVKLSRIVGNPYDAEEGEPERTGPVSINPEAVRCFYARKDNKPGTRITFTDGGGFAVAEPPEVVEARLTGAPDPVPEPPLRALPAPAA